jgi:hypothetical protein
MYRLVTFTWSAGKEYRYEAVQIEEIAQTALVARVELFLLGFLLYRN